jgi:hypothetical protein
MALFPGISLLSFYVQVSACRSKAPYSHYMNVTGCYLKYAFKNRGFASVPRANSGITTRRQIGECGRACSTSHKKKPTV